MILPYSINISHNINCILHFPSSTTISIPEFLQQSPPTFTLQIPIKYTAHIIKMKAQEGQKQLKKYAVIEQIGQGATSKVYKALIRGTKKSVAIKAIRLKILKRSSTLKGLINTEIQVLRMCNNPNVVSYINHFSTEENLYIVMEYCNQGDLATYLSIQGKISEEKAVKYLGHIINGFKGLHEIGVMHRDLKLANIFKHNGVCKIGDLGFSKQFQAQNPIAWTVLGTSLTMAPEILSSQSYCYEADIWSLGVIFYQMLYGKYPYTGKTDNQILSNILTQRPQYTRATSHTVRDFLNKCLTVDRQHRITWKQIHEHPLFNHSKNKQSITDNTTTSLIKSKEPVQDHQLPNQVLTSIEKHCNLNPEQKQPPKVSESQLQQTYNRYELYYKQSIQNQLFCIKYLNEYYKVRQHISNGHYIALFILTKYIYENYRVMTAKMLIKNNIYGFKQHFEGFVSSGEYFKIRTYLQKQAEKVRNDCQAFKRRIKICENRVRRQYDMSEEYGESNRQLVRDILDQYLEELGKSLAEVEGSPRDHLLVAIAALKYYRKDLKASIAEFEQELSNGDIIVQEL